jgi:hypothetical protein
MKKLALLLAGATLLALTACNPADTVPEAHAAPREFAGVSLWPAPAADAVDGEVYEYR